MEALASALIVIAVIGYFAFNQYLKLHRRVLISRERLAALERGVDLPVVDQEVKRSTWNVQRFLLLCGMIWIALGISAFAVLSRVVAFPQESTHDVPPGIQHVGIAPVGIGIAHLITYWVGARRERNGK